MKEFLRLIKKWAIRLLLVVITLFILISLFLNSLTYSEGFIIGKPTTFSKRGFVFKTYEGEIKVSGTDFSEIEGIDSGKWRFSVEKDIEEDVLNSIEIAIQDNKRAKFYYKEKYLTFSWSGDTKYYVYDIEIIE